MLTLILAESAMELIPKEIQKHPSLARRSQFLKKSPSELLLDRSYHHLAMSSLKEAEKRGRPDIVHLCLLSALGTPLNRELMLRVYVHTFDDKVISVAPEARLPRNYDRFKGLLEQLYRTHRVPSEGNALLEIRNETLKDLLRRLNHSRVLALSVLGTESTPAKVVEPLISLENPVLVIGGFPKGHFSKPVTQLFDALVSVDREGLDAWVVVSRLIYEFEKQSNLPARRWYQMHRKE